MPPVSLTARDVAAAAGGRVISGDVSTPIGRISIDSRTVGAGEFFVAIRGERFDGHDFVPAAIEAGAVGALVDRIDVAAQVPAGTLLIAADDTTRALQDVARYVRRRSGARVVAITGSAGKTTTKEVCAALLAARYRVFRNKGNLNNHIGLPLSLFELREGPEAAVVELGMNHPGEIRTLVGIAEPEVRVWTNVGDAHIGFFPSSDAIADAKAEILEGATADTVLVANADDPRVMTRARGFAGRTITFGTAEGASVRASNIQLLGLDGVRAAVDTPSGRFDLQSPLLGAGNLSNVLAATAVAIEFEIPLDEIAARTAALRPAYHRGELLRLRGGVNVIDDSYNSSPAALKRSLEVLDAARGSERKIAVLGEMLELGEHTDALHRECGRAAQAAGVDLLVAVGGSPAEQLADAARAAGLAPDAVVFVRDREQAIEEVLRRVRPGDLVLVKGSRGIGLDAVVERLKAEFA
ncbi:MAG TPA: UDP-N-acetylmuramoyl-tripeptide--D-alanyl-D-alanine ligase [Vicinamibacterales bacterium]